MFSKFEKYFLVSLLLFASCEFSGSLQLNKKDKGSNDKTEVKNSQGRQLEEKKELSLTDIKGEKDKNLNLKNKKGDHFTVNEISFVGAIIPKDPKRASVNGSQKNILNNNNNHQSQATIAYNGHYNTLNTQMDKVNHTQTTNFSDNKNDSNNNDLLSNNNDLLLINTNNASSFTSISTQEEMDLLRALWYRFQQQQGKSEKEPQQQITFTEKEEMNWLREWYNKFQQYHEEKQKRNLSGQTTNLPGLEGDRFNNPYYDIEKDKSGKISGRLKNNYYDLKEEEREIKKTFDIRIPVGDKLFSGIRTTSLKGEIGERKIKSVISGYGEGIEINEEGKMFKPTTTTYIDHNSNKPLNETIMNVEILSPEKNLYNKVHQKR